eukprot:20385-Heterococcus_DN1.PRE.1
MVVFCVCSTVQSSTVCEQYSVRTSYNQHVHAIKHGYSREQATDGVSSAYAVAAVITAARRHMPCARMART